MAPKSWKQWATVFAALIVGVTVALLVANQQRQPTAQSTLPPAPETPLAPAIEAVAATEPAPSQPETPAIGRSAAKRPIPDDLVDDEHVREEFGINEVTTPSIDKLFEVLNGLGTLNYDKLKRSVNRPTPADRVLVSMELGTLIAEGFLIVHCEKPEAINAVGSALIGYAKALSAGKRINTHTQSLMDHSLAGKWAQLRKELAATQRDVEIEMVQLQDVHVAHLISLGGWVRAFEIATRGVVDHYSEETSRRLTRHDIASYYLSSLDELIPMVESNASLKALRKVLADLLPLIDVPEGKALTFEEVKVLSAKAQELSNIIIRA